MKTMLFVLLAKWGFVPHREPSFYDQYLRRFFEFSGIFAWAMIVIVVILLIFGATGNSKDEKNEKKED